MKKRILISIIVELVIAFILFYVFIPPINIGALEFWVYVITLIVIYYFIASFRNLFNTEVKFTKRLSDLPKFTLVTLFLCSSIIVLTVLTNFIVSPVFNAKSYSRRIIVNESASFTEDIKEADFNKIPLLDRNSSEKLGDRVMGEYSNYVSQFYVSDEYTQINYKDEIVRVTPLEYDGFIKWFTNKHDGIGAYITVNSVNGASKLVKLPKGMKYLKSAYFNKNLDRKLRFKYPFTNFGTAKFEIDNEGKPYYIVPTISYTGVNNKAKVTGAIVFNPVDGSSKKYALKDVPTWVDNVYPHSLVLELINDWGKYRKGFINSKIGQKSVVKTTRGYNYLALDNDIYLYTGITSVLSDESNLGFILTNLRTGDTSFYKLPGAEEYSAMDSAKGQVQQMDYKATFPLLININGRATYLISLKDKAGLVKMYAFVDVKDYQKVSVTDASLGINKAKENYLKTSPKTTNENELVTKDIVVKSITNAVIEATTYYYIDDANGDKYIASIKLSDTLPFIKENDTLSVSYYETEGIKEIIRIN